MVFIVNGGSSFINMVPIGTEGRKIYAKEIWNKVSKLYGKNRPVSPFMESLERGS